MAKQTVTNEQVRLAAAAGIQLLSDPTLPVPLSIGKTGALGILEGVLTALASGEVMLTNVPTVPPQPGDPAEVPDADAKNKGADAPVPIAPVESEEEDSPVKAVKG